MTIARVALALISTGLMGVCMSESDLAAQTAGRSVVINRIAMPEQIIEALELKFGTTVPNGRYWYDNLTGAWGQEGGPTLGFTLAGLNVGGPLRADASNWPH